MDLPFTGNYTLKEFLIPIINSLVVLVMPVFADAQNMYWQQQIKYTIDVHLDVNTNLLKGTQNIIYTNNSPDTLPRLFFHTYWNAFKPGSNMDLRSREFGTIEISKDKNGKPRYDWDNRITDRISKLKPYGTGLHHFGNSNCKWAAPKHYRP
jgi:hypothetical protein